MDSVFIFARMYLGTDTGWSFATGAPNLGCGCLWGRVFFRHPRRAIDKSGAILVCDVTAIVRDVF